MWANLPDVAHTASADAAVGYFEADCFQSVRFAGCFQPSIVEAVGGQLIGELDSINNLYLSKEKYSANLQKRAVEMDS